MRVVANTNSKCVSGKYILGPFTKVPPLCLRNSFPFVRAQSIPLYAIAVRPRDGPFVAF